MRNGAATLRLAGRGHPCDRPWVLSLPASTFLTPSLVHNNAASCRLPAAPVLELSILPGSQSRSCRRGCRGFGLDAWRYESAMHGNDLAFGARHGICKSWIAWARLAPATEPSSGPPLSASVVGPPALPTASRLSSAPSHLQITIAATGNIKGTTC
ncbi:hypothetical protein Micbo1qcDRAFT_59447 [Microdochium bolleyi]|uniref:Uncharacterized protein n=1 Tax=Microdochium bolleyi TaxID=196109 RepID=A0A136J4I0_9PEZI|nr:hypothetical protein Micbo1qcDRAFT_59447 [Microdochium bolleyi]